MTSVAATAKKGNHLDTLKAVRDRLAADLDDASPTVAAQIAGQLRQTLESIVQIESLAKAVDELEPLRTVRRGEVDIATPSRRRRRVAS